MKAGTVVSSWVTKKLVLAHKITHCHIPEAASPSEMYVPIYQTAQQHTSADHNHHKSFLI
jgi:hypothetical protein